MSQTLLARAALFSEITSIAEIFEEHDRRCSFRALQDAFDRLKVSDRQSIDEILEIVAFEDHFRNFMSERLNLPLNYRELFFGRSFSELVGIFGFSVENEADGTRVLVQNQELRQDGV